jgi:hypothetical protein
LSSLPTLPGSHALAFRGAKLSSRLTALHFSAFGVRLPFRRLRQRNGTAQSLTFSQHMWLMGVLGWGCGMWIVTTFDDYLDWKYWSGSAHDLSAGKLLFHAVLWPLAGVLFGWMTWNARTGTAES